MNTGGSAIPSLSHRGPKLFRRCDKLGPWKWRRLFQTDHSCDCGNFACG